MKKLHLLFWVFFAVVLLPQNLSAMLDEVHHQMTLPFELPLRWDNVEDRPFYVHGSKPKYSWKHGLHVFTLEPGEASYIRLPAHERMRILLVEPANETVVFSAGISNGTGLFCFMPLKKDMKTNSYLLEPDADGTSLVAIRQPAESGKSVHGRDSLDS